MTTDDGFLSPVQQVRLPRVNVRLSFSDHALGALDVIVQSDAVIGCVAWLTSSEVLDALTTLKNGCDIIVHQDDDVLSRWDVREMYSKCKPLDNGMMTNDVAFRSIRPEMCGGCRWMAHHKFLVGLKLVSEPKDAIQSHVYRPHMVWCGSSNLTKSATRGMDHSMVIVSRKVSAAFAEEHSWAEDHAVEIDGLVSSEEFYGIAVQRWVDGAIALSKMAGIRKTGAKP